MNARHSRRSAETNQALRYAYWLPILLSCAAFLLLPQPAHAQAPPLVFYDPFNSFESISNNGGHISGPIAFVSGVNSNGAYFGGGTYIFYTNHLFASTNGTVSLWLKPDAGKSGGIFQIGTLGNPNSLGAFFSGTNIWFEFRNNGGTNKQVYAPLGTNFTHIAAMWENRGSNYSIKLFTNGIFVFTNGWAEIASPFLHITNCIVIGYVGWYGLGEGIIDEFKFFNRMLNDAEVYADYVYSSGKHKYQASTKPKSTGPVQIEGSRLYVNGQPFTVQGVGYQPVPKGQTPQTNILAAMYSDTNIMNRDLPLLREMGVNTVRFWAQLQNTILLDRLWNNGTNPIYAIMAFQVPSSGEEPGIDYSDTNTVAKYVAGISNYVTTFKDHPAVLGWAIGNENNLHYIKDKSDWYRLAEKLAEAAYNAERPAYHPTILVNGHMLYFGNTDLCSDDVSLEFVDMWGHNSYLGNDLTCYFDYYNKISAKPLVITEYGTDAWDNAAGMENEERQSQWAIEQWQQIRRRCVGGTLMAYNDEWWKSGSPATHDTNGHITDVGPDRVANEEWWGIMKIAGTSGTTDILIPRLIYYDLQRMFCPYALSLLTEGGGTVSMWPTNNPFISNAVVTVRATPASGWTLLQWLGDVSGTNLTNTIVMTRDKCAQAVFGTRLNTAVAGSGAVLVEPATTWYPYGYPVRLTAAPQEGNAFVVWGNSASSTNNPLVYPMTNANPNISCLFAGLSGGQCALTVIASGGGDVQVTPRANRYTTGQSVALQAIPEPGEDFLGWSGNASGTETNLPVLMSQSKVITAEFTRRGRLVLGPCRGGAVDGNFRFTLVGGLGESYRIESSSGAGWGPMLTVTNTFGALQFVEPLTNAPWKLYRAVHEP